ncbi:hypothetical protein BASA81_000879 [Batrachochytrium salamandrivorans]|nr:hypothetical protein BASA81_000879 [Batrachochytrium salamandrivorans]
MRPIPLSRSSSTSSLPQVPIFAPIDSPLPPVGSARNWENVISLSEELSASKAAAAASASSTPTKSPLENDEFYGSEDDENEILKLTVEELQQRCMSLMEAAKRHAKAVPASPRNPPQILSPALYSVYNTKSANSQMRQHGVKRLQLGRTSSISTRDELGKLPRFAGEHVKMDDTGVAQTNRLNHVLKFPPTFEYLHSSLFADDILDLCTRITPLFEKESRVLELKSPIYVFGDTHGNVNDLNFFAETVWPLSMPLTAGSFLFLGDYVDRGDGGLEVLAYLFAQKVQVPHKLFLLRGNHETRSVNGWEDYYGNASFLAQCKNRFGESKGCVVWEECNRVFDRMPLAAIIDKTIFCVHGGIPRPSPTLLTDGKDTRLDDIRKIPCPIDVRQPSIPGTGPYNRLAFSLLWSDPAATEQEHMLEKETGFGASMRGSGSVVFGMKAVEDFLSNFKLGYIMRAHEATANGVAVSKSAKVLTVFSTSKDHGCGGDAKCGCVLVDVQRIVAIIRSPEYEAAAAAAAAASNSGGIGNDASSAMLSRLMVTDYKSRPASPQQQQRMETVDEDEDVRQMCDDDC